MKSRFLSLAFAPLLALVSIAPVRAASQMHRVVFECSRSDHATWTAMLNNVQNLQKRFGEANTELEVVAHGPGIAFLLRTDTLEAHRIAMLHAQHVEFAACHNTMMAKHISPADLLPEATIVPSGVGELVLKQEAGWAYLKSGI